VTLKEWALRKFVDSEISDKLSEIAIVKDLSYFECKHIVTDALETSSLQFPNDDFQYQMIREQFLLRKYILREISASNLLSISFRELVMKMNTDVKFKIWSKIDVEIDIMTYERDPKLTDFEIDSYIDSELKNAFMIPFDHSERYSLQPN
jgi:hypothetical protein